MHKKIVWTVFFFGILILPVFANEVAMVKELNGKIEANLNGEVWNIELAEMLEADTKITLFDSKSFVRLIHLNGDKEYQIEGKATAKILSEKIECDRAAESKIKLVSADLGLGLNMQNQAGTVVNDRLVIKSKDEAPSFSARFSRLPPASMKKPPISKKKPVVIGADEFADSDDFESAQKEETVKVSETLAFALPGLIKDDCKVRINKPVLAVSFKNLRNIGWSVVVVELYEASSAQKNIQVSVKLKNSIKKIDLDSFAEADVSLSRILKLEGQKNYEQAAAAWIKFFAEKKLSRKTLTQHLNRLKRKMK